MSQQFWSETLVAGDVTSGTKFVSYTTAKSVTPPGAAISLPANFFNIGRKMRMTIVGSESHTTGGTMTFQFQLGAVAALSSGALTMTTTTHTDFPFIATCYVQCRSVGTSTAATLLGQWIVQGQGFAMTSAADNAAGTGYAIGPATIPAVGTGFDSTATQTLDFFAAVSVSNSSSGIQVHEFIVEALN